MLVLDCNPLLTKRTVVVFPDYKRLSYKPLRQNRASARRHEPMSGR